MAKNDSDNKCQRRKEREEAVFCPKCGSRLELENIPQPAPKQPKLSIPAEQSQPVTQVKDTESTPPKEQNKCLTAHPSKSKDGAGAERKPNKRAGIIAVLLLVAVAVLYSLSAKVPTVTEAPPEKTPESTTVSTPVPTYASCQVGDKFTFGSYPQGPNGEEAPIGWQVLERENDRLLVITEYGLDAKAYNEKWGNTNWSQCTLRTWLNREFLERAFTPEEQRSLMEVTLANPNSPADWNNVPGGPGTRDKVFLLSYDEAKHYFGSDAERHCKPTAYAVVQGAWVDDNPDYAGTGWWWLRSPGLYVYNAAAIHSAGDFRSSYVNDVLGTVRPTAFLAL